MHQQECIPVGCVPPAHYRTGGLHDRDPPGQRPRSPDRDPHRTETLQQKHPWDRDRDPPRDQDPL